MSGALNLYEIRQVPLSGGSASLLRRVSDVPGEAIAGSTSWYIGAYELHLLTDWGAQNRVLTSGVVFPAGISVDGQRYAAAVRNDLGGPTVFRVGVGSRESDIRLPSGYEAVGSLAWHPNGAFFIVMANDTQNGRTVLVRLPVDGTIPTILPTLSGRSVTQFAVSPDGSSITYTTEGKPGQTLIEIDISELIR